MIASSTSAGPGRRISALPGWLGEALALGLVILAIVVATVWGTLVLYYLAPGPGGIRTAAAGFAFLGLSGLAGLPRRRVPVSLMAALIPAAMIWNGAKPSADRDWQPEVAVLPHAEVNGDLATVHAIRNFDYRIETDFTPAHYDKTRDLRKLDRVDLVG